MRNNARLIMLAACTGQSPESSVMQDQRRDFERHVEVSTSQPVRHTKRLGTCPTPKAYRRMATGNRVHQENLT